MATPAAADWATTGLRQDSDQEEDLCVGTFRWKASHVLPLLPPPPPATTASASASALGAAAASAAAPSLPTLHPAAAPGWARWMQGRLGAAVVPTASAAGAFARQHPSLLDGMSYPLSLGLALGALGVTAATLNARGVETLHVVVAGASSKAEERLLRDSNYWEELGNMYHGVHVQLWMVGPEIEVGCGVDAGAGAGGGEGDDGEGGTSGNGGGGGGSRKRGGKKSNKKKGNKKKAAAGGRAGSTSKGGKGEAVNDVTGGRSPASYKVAPNMSAAPFRGTYENGYWVNPARL